MGTKGGRRKWDGVYNDTRIIVQFRGRTREDAIKAQMEILKVLDTFNDEVKYRMDIEEGKPFKKIEDTEELGHSLLHKNKARQFNNPVSDNPPVDEKVLTPEAKEAVLDHNLPKPNGGKPKPDWTEEDLRSAVQEIWKIPNGGQVEAQTLMKKYHVNRVSQIPEDRWAEFMSEATMVIVNLRERKN